jgi:DNA-3-methyladenine glycosylase II
MHYVSHLSKDEKLKKLIRDHGTFKLNKKKNLYLYLCYSIMSQQFSTKVASVIKQRFIDLYGENQHHNRSLTPLLQNLGALV